MWNKLRPNRGNLVLWQWLLLVACFVACFVVWYVHEPDASTAHLFR